MLSRRRFLGTISALPLAAGAGAESGQTAASSPRRTGKRDYFRDLGVRPFINAAGTYTAMTASLMAPEVMDAIAYASKHYVMLDELHDKVGERIATLLHSEAAMVTAGAASALTLGTAGVLTGTDRKKIGDLPDLTGMKSDVIIQKAHRFGYEHAVRNTGIRFVEVETREELERAVGPQTAMMLFFNAMNREGKIQDEEFAALGKKHGVPTFVDAAADVPPVENFWKYTKMGFDLVTFSGGKGIRGPQSAGLLLGGKHLIESARLNASPNGNAIGRGMKVNKEEMLGMMVAVERFLDLDHAREGRDYTERAETIRAAAALVPGVSAEIFVPEIANHVPHVRISWEAAAGRPTPAAVVTALRAGEPSIAIRAEAATLVVGVWMMRSGEEKVVARRLRQALAALAAG